MPAPPRRISGPWQVRSSFGSARAEARNRKRRAARLRSSRALTLVSSEESFCGPSRCVMNRLTFLQKGSRTCRPAGARASFCSLPSLTASHALASDWANSFRASGAGITPITHFRFPRSVVLWLLTNLTWLTRDGNGVDPSPTPPQNAQRRRAVGAPAAVSPEARPRSSGWHLEEVRA